MKNLKRYALAGGLLILLGSVLWTSLLVGIAGWELANYDDAISHLYWPSLFLLILGTLGVCAAILGAAVIVLRSIRRNIIELPTVTLLKRMGHASMFSALIVLFYYIYLMWSFLNVRGNYRGPYELFFPIAFFACLTAALAFYFIAQVIADAVAYREENELTV